MELAKLLKKKEQYTAGLTQIGEVPLEKFQTAFAIEFTHNSTAIEGNTLTLLETKLLLEDQISVGGKALREVYEVVNHHKATLYVERCVKEGLPLDERRTKDIHAIINENIFVGGIYRNEPVRIGGASHKPPVGQEMFLQIKDFFGDMTYLYQDNPIALASWTHAEFVRIHPFTDGNGRTARQILNYQLMFHGFPPISIGVADRFAYYEHLDHYATTKDIAPFSDMVATLVDARLDEFLEMV